MSHRGIHITVGIETAQGWQTVISADSDVLYFRQKYSGKDEGEDLLADMFEPLKLRVITKAIELPDEYGDDT